MNCPTCGEPLEGRGPFDGRVGSTGVTDGHEGFGDTFMCGNGHWWARIQGALIEPERILTVVERSQLDAIVRPPYLVAGDKLLEAIPTAASLPANMARVVIAFNAIGYDDFTQDEWKACRLAVLEALQAARGVLAALEEVARVTRFTA